MSTINGTSGSDTLTGTGGTDVISGGSGDDTLVASGGSDILLGGSGSDTLDGGSGNDILLGGSGDDTLDGGSGSDLLLGGTGDDTLDGGSGNDLLNGGSGDDTLDGGEGSDLLLGGSGDDTIAGGAGDDFLLGGAGDDVLDGGAGTDGVLAGSGDDVAIYVVAENAGEQDFYDGGKGTDTLRLVLTQAEFDTAAIQADLAAFQAFLAANANAGSTFGPQFQFTAFDLTVRNFEQLEIVIVPGGGNQAPVAQDDSFTVAEDGALLGNVLADNGGGADADADGGTLAIVAGTFATAQGGTVTLLADGSFAYTPAANFNGADSFDYTLLDGQGGQDTGTVNITVTAVNDAPEVANPIADQSTAEEAAFSFVVPANAFADVDFGDTQTLSATLADGTPLPAWLNFNAATRTFSGTPDDADLGTIAVKVTATDGAGASVSDTFDLTVTPVNDAPSDIALGNDTIVKTQAGAIVGALTVTDVDAGDTHALAVIGDARFEIVNGNLKLKAGQSLAAEPGSTLDVTVQATDSGNLSRTETFTLNLQATNAPVTNLALTNAAVDENSAGAVVGTLVPIDADPSDVYQYSLSDSRFEVAGSVLKLKDGVSLDHEAEPTVALAVTVTDGGGAQVTRNFEIAVTDVNDAPVAADQAFALAENAAAGAAVGTVVASDQDGPALTYAIAGGNTGGAFAIDANSGAITVANPAAIDFETNPNFALEVEVSDGTASATATVTVNLSNANDTPSAILLSNAAVNEETDGAVIGTLSVVDQDTGDVHSLSVTTGGDRFEIVGNTLKLKSGESLNFENPLEQSVTVEVTATDLAGAAHTQSFTIQAIDGKEGKSPDGYIAGATVFEDLDNDGVLDPGEASAVTDNQGDFVLFGAQGTAPLVLTGGTDISTGIAFGGVFRAPAGYTDITPVSTLVQALVEQLMQGDPGLGLAAAIDMAEAQIIEGLGFDIADPLTFDLATFDPIAETLALNPDAETIIQANIQVANTFSQAAALLVGAGATTAAAYGALADALAAQIDADATANAVTALTSTAVISGIVLAAATALGVDANIDQTLAGATDVITASNTSVETAVAGGATGADLLTDLAQTAIVADDSAANLTTAAEADAVNDPNTGALIDQTVTDFTGTNLDNAVAAAESQVGDVDGAQIGTSANDVLTGGVAGDIIEGRAGLDTLSGLGGNDQLFGGEDDDVLIGGPGNDLIDGGEGISVGGALENRIHPNFGDSDVASYEFAGAGVSVNLALGTALDGDGGTDTLVDIEGVQGSMFADTLVGGSAASLDPLTGFEFFLGMQGADTITGGAGFSQINYNFDPLGVSVDLQAGTATDGWSNADNFSSIESVVGSDHADTLLGSNNPANTLERFRGRAGADTIDGRLGFDEVDYAFTAVTAGVVLNLQSGFATNDGHGFTDTLFGIEAVRGSELGDTLIGSDGGFNRFRPMAGDDFVKGFDTADLGTDEVSYDFAPNSVSVNLALGSAFDGWGGTDTLIGIENATGSRFAGDILVGNSGVNVLRGLGGDDQLFGGGGNDQLFGGDGNDTLFGEDGNDFLSGEAGNDQLFGGRDGDTLDGGAGDDLIDGGEGHTSPVFHARFDFIDSADFRTATAAVSVDLAAGKATGAASGSDTLVDIEGAIGTAFNDVIVGLDADPRFGTTGYTGMAGDDIITGGATGLQQVQYNIVDGAALPGAGVSVNLALGKAIDNWGNTDTLTNITAVVGSGNADTLIGDGGNNRLRGLAGNDTLDGGGGIDEADYVFSGAFAGVTVNLSLATNQTSNDGRNFVDNLISIENIRGSELGDTLTGDGNDNRFRPMGGADNVDGGGGVDEVNYFNEPAAVSVDLQAGTAIDGYGFTDTLANIENIFGTLESDTLRGDAGANRIRGDEGDDTIQGRGGADALEGGIGDDVYEYTLGDGGDTITDIGGVDTLMLLGRLGDFRSFTRVGDDLAIEFDDVAVTTVAGHYAGQSLERIVFAESFFFPTMEALTYDIRLGFTGAASGNLNEIFVGTAAGETIDGGDGSDLISGHGGDDTLIGGAGDDVLVGGAGADILDGGSTDGAVFGVDFASYTGSPTGVTIHLGTGIVSGGDAAGDTLISIEGVLGSDHDDDLTGSDLNVTERFAGRAGNDTIDGGGGFDQVEYFESPAGIAVTRLADGSATVLDGFSFTDTLANIEEYRGSRFDDSFSSSFGAGFERFRPYGGDDLVQGGAGTDEIDYLPARTGVTVDLTNTNSTGGFALDGEGGTDALFSIEFVRGGMFDDTLIGSSANNRFRGLRGDDVLNGAGGGDDHADYSTDAGFFGTLGITANLAAGTATDGWGDTDTLISIERVTGTAAADTFVGSDTNDPNIAFDVFEGLAGNDSIDGGGSIDQANYNASPAGVIVNLSASAQVFNATPVAAGTALDGWGSTDTLTRIEVVQGSAFADAFFGGNPGALPGGIDFERFIGLAGNDFIDGGAGFDELDYRPSPGAVTVNLSSVVKTDVGGFAIAPIGAFTAFDGHGGTDTFANIEAVRGSSFADVLIGGDGNDRFRGIGGADRIDGGLGIDEIDHSTDVNSGGNAAVSVNLGIGQARDGFGQTDTLTSIENARGTGFADTLIGDGNANRLRGEGGNDFLSGGGGNDTLEGGTGDDTLDGGDGLDNLVGGAGNDTFDGGTAVGDFSGTGFAAETFDDRVDYSGDPAGVSVNLGAGTATDGFGGLDTITNVESIVDSAFDDTLIGGSNDVFENFFVSAGTDFVDGGSGFDQINYAFNSAAVTIDTVAGTALDGHGNTDTFVGIESFSGSAFADRFIGSGASFERFRGRAGNDVIDAGGGFDEIDYLLAATGVVISFAAGMVTNDGEGGVDTITGVEAVRGSMHADDITGGGGAFERYRALAGADTIDGGAGTDQADYSADALMGGFGAVTVDLAAGTAIDGFGFTDALMGIEQVRGTGANDSIAGDAGANILEGLGGDDQLFGRGGNDQLFGGLGNDVLMGEDGNDTLFGEAGNDQLFGGTGDDTLDGGAGDDVIDGGEGLTPGTLSFGVFHTNFGDQDLADYRASASAVTVDLAAGTATGLSSGNDTLLNLEGAFGSNFDDTIVGFNADPLFGSGFYIGMQGNDTITGGLTGAQFVGYHVTDGAAIPGAGVIVNLSSTMQTVGTVNLAAGTAIDNWGNTDTLSNIFAVIGSDNADTLIGSSGSNRLRGRAGNDTLDGGGGTDEADYLFSGVTIGATVDLSIGQATNDGHGFVDTLISIENIRGSELGDTLTGDAGGNRFTPMGGADIVNGGGGIDEISYGFDPNAVSVDLQAGSAIDGYGFTDTLTSIENVTGSLEGDTLRGNAGANVLRGNDGDDQLFGGAGNDQLFGGNGNDTLFGEDGNEFLSGEAGNDQLFGGTGDDTLDGGAGDDVIDGGEGVTPGTVSQGFLHVRFGDADLADYRSSASSVSVNFATGTAVGAGTGTDTLINLEGVFGSNFNDTIVGADGDPVFGGFVYFGMQGDDAITGGLTGLQQVHYNASAGAPIGAGVIVNLSSMMQMVGTVSLAAGTAIDNWGNTDTLTNINAVVGSLNNDTLIGNDGNNRLRGRSGSDTLDGGLGIDEADYLFSAVATGVTVDLSLGQALNDGFSTVDTLMNIENIRGSELGDTLIGDANNNRFRPMGGADNVNGGGGIDEVNYFTEPNAVSVDLEAGTAIDGYGFTDTLANIENVTGTLESDTLRGDANANVLRGEEGDDFLFGRGGADQIDGGLGVDEIDHSTDVNSGGNLGVSVNLAAGQARDGFGATDTLTSIENARGTGFADTLIGDGNANRLRGEAGNDFLSGGGGNDTLEGGTGDDTLDGGAGDDVIDGGEGVTPGTIAQGFLHVRFDSADVADYRSAGASVSVDFAAGIAIGAATGTDTLLNLEGVLGSNFDDTIVGADGDPLFGGFSYFGMQGNDVITGGLTGLQQVHYNVTNGAAIPGAGVIVNLSSLTQMVGTVSLAAGTAIDNWGNTDTLTNINAVVGSLNNDTLIGNDGNNRLRGRAGADTIDGGGGIDTADYLFSGVSTGVTVDLSLGQALNDGHGFVDTLTSIENIRGSEKGDTLTGDAGANRFTPMGGADNVNGGDGIDEVNYFLEPNAVSVDLQAGTAIDGYGFTDTLANIENVTGTLEGDTLRGDGNANVLRGEEGDDTIEGRAGNDTLIGGDGDDLFVFTAGTGQDTVTDFAAGQGGPDQLDLRAFGFADFATFEAAAADVGSDVVIDLDGAGGTDAVTLLGVQKAQLHADDVLLS